MTDTRGRIQEVALELFSEQGYENTPLSQIAERLGVTKAAVYYHFKSKDDIIASCIDDWLAMIDGILAWAAGEPPGPQRSREVIRRYCDGVRSAWRGMRVFQENQPAIRRMERFAEFRKRMLALHEVVVPGDPELTDRIRALAAINVLHTGWFLREQVAVSEEELREALLTVSYDLIGVR